jgi:Kef-type K+ transport system membrane component KefB
LIVALAAGLIVLKVITNFGASLIFKWSVPGSVQIGFLLGAGIRIRFRYIEPT